MDRVGNADLVIGALLGGDKACILGRPVGELFDALIAQAHHAAERLTDDAVKCDEYGERDQRPQAAGGGACTLLLIKLHDLLLILLLIAPMLFLQLLKLRLDTGGLHHALFALCHERQQDQVDHERKEDNGKAVAVGPVIKDLQQSGKRPDYNIP